MELGSQSPSDSWPCQQPPRVNGVLGAHRTADLCNKLLGLRGTVHLAPPRPGTLPVGPCGLWAGPALASLRLAVWMSDFGDSPSSWPALDSEPGVGCLNPQEVGAEATGGLVKGRPEAP